MADWYNKTERLLEKIQAETADINSKLNAGALQHPDDVFYTNQQFLQLMDISKRTAQEWRDKKIIGYFQIGNKIYYRLSDIKKLLKENYKPKNEK